MDSALRAARAALRTREDAAAETDLGGLVNAILSACSPRGTHSQPGFERFPHGMRHAASWLHGFMASWPEDTWRPRNLFVQGQLRLTTPLFGRVAACSWGYHPQLAPTAIPTLCSTAAFPDSSSNENHPVYDLYLPPLQTRQGHSQRKGTPLRGARHGRCAERPGSSKG